MLHSGHNEIEGIPVEVVRKRIRRINIRVAADGTVCLSVPKWWATLRQGEEFLREKWRWVKKTRAEVLARPAATRAPVTEAELEALRTLLGELNAMWAARVGEKGVSWKIRRVKSLWGCCHWRDRYITYNAELARAPRDLVEYVVAHEYTHFARPIAAACAVGLRPVDMSTTTARSSTPSWTSGFRAGRPSGDGSTAVSGARRARTRYSRPVLRLSRSPR